MTFDTVCDCIKNVHNIIFEWPEYDHVQVDIELDMLSSVMVFHYGTLATKICLDPQLYYYLSAFMLALFPHSTHLLLKTAAAYLVISVGKMSSSAFTTASQFWLLFTFLLITISLELALLIFKLDLWIQAWTLREQNQQEVLDLSQRWVLVKNSAFVMMCIISSRFVVTSSQKV